MVRSFAIVPAAGRSVRMGRPKLLLPLGDRTVIEHVLAAWTGSRVTRTVVVVRPGDAALVTCCRGFAVDVVTPVSAPLDMKASIAVAIEHIANRYQPDDGNAWLVAPADMPYLSSQAIDRVLDAFRPDRPHAVAPTFCGRRGHPVLLPWALARHVQGLAPHEGIGALLARTPVRECECDAVDILGDLDVPADYAALVSGNAHSQALETGRRAPVF